MKFFPLFTVKKMNRKDWLLFSLLGLALVFSFMKKDPENQIRQNGRYQLHTIRPDGLGLYIKIQDDGRPVYFEDKSRKFDPKSIKTLKK